MLTSKQRVLNILLVDGDCMLVCFQPIQVYMSKVDGKFNFSPISVNFLTEITKFFFALVMLLLQVGEKPLLSISTFMQLYFNPATVKILSNLKVLVIALLLKVVMKRRFSIIQSESQTKGVKMSAPPKEEVEGGKEEEEDDDEQGATCGACGDNYGTDEFL